MLGDHAEVFAVSQTGFAVIGSQNAQEAHDLALASHIITRLLHTPALHFYDGSITDADSSLSQLATETLQQISQKYKSILYTEPEPVASTEGAEDSAVITEEQVDEAQVFLA